MYLPLQNPLAENIAHRKTYLENNGLTGKQIAIADLVHWTRVAIIDRRSPYIVPQTDALVTKESDIVLTLTGADCFPLFFEEKGAGIIGLAHGGWRGIVGGIVAETQAAITGLGGEPGKTILTIGPGICAKHFEIQEDVLEKFAAYSEYVSRDSGIHVDLKGIIRAQAVAAGITPQNVIDSGECTFCLPKKYFSYRRDKPEYLEAQLAFIVQFAHRKF